MRPKIRSVVLVAMALGVTLSAASCAGKAKRTATASAGTPKVAPLAPPPDTLTMKVDVTPPKPPAPLPPPVSPKPDACAVLAEQLASLRVHFDYDRSSISPAAVEEVDAIHAALRAGGLGSSAQFSIEGHCDARGSEGYNVALSEQRAKAVLDRLVDLGSIRVSQSKTQPWGKEKPLDAASTPAAYARNRRVEILVSCPVK